MTDNGTRELFKLVKMIVDNYINNRRPAGIVLGTYNGSSVLVGDRLPLPMSLIRGNMKEQLAAGDKIRLLRDDGGQEYFILEIIGKPYMVMTEEVEQDG